jgi:hypothetical protein
LKRWIVNDGSEAQRGDRTDPGRRHQGAHLSVMARQLHDFAVEIANLSRAIYQTSEPLLQQNRHLFAVACTADCRFTPTTDKLKTPGAARGNPSTAAACWREARVERFAEFKSPRRWIPGGNG